MPNPKKIIKAVKAVKKAAQRAETNKIQKNSVKVKPARTAPKTGLENRGNRVSAQAAKNRAGDYLWDMQEKAHEAQIDRMAAGMKGPKMGPISTGGKKNIKKFNAISKQSKAKTPIKINSNPKRGK